MLSKLRGTTLGALLGLFCLCLAAPQVHAQSPINPSFESPVVTANTDSLRPTTATWAFTGQSGIRNNSAPNGSSGKQAAFLSAAPISGNNNLGSVRQTVTLKPGTYYVRYLAAVKTPSGRPQPLQFYINSTPQGGVLRPRYLTDATTGGFEAGWTQPFIVTTTGSYELRFDATNATNYGTVAAPLYAVAYVDAITIVSVPSAFANSGFEATSTWTLSSGATQVAATDAPEGAKVLSLASAGTAAQTLALPAGRYSVSLNIGKASVATGTLNVEVASNGGATVTVATISASIATEYRTHTTAGFALAAGNHVVTLRASGSAFSLDNVVLNDAAPDAVNAGFETPVLANPSSTTAAGTTVANPMNATWAFSGTGGLIQTNAGTSNTSAPRTVAGKQYLALSGTGAVAQSLVFAGGTYVAIGQVAQGGLNVLIDGAAVAKLSASTLDFREVMSAPFVVAAGTHSLGLSVDSTYAPATPKLDEIRLLRVDAPPVVSITAPANGALYQTGATVNITANASDPDGLSSLAIATTPSGGSATQLATSATSPLSTTWTNVSANSYTITATATDSTGATNATAINIRVNANPNAIVSLSPAGPVVTSATAVATTLTVSSATDSDGTVTKVEFLQDGVVATTCTKTIPPAVAPFTCALSLAPRATAYALTVRVTDNDGGVTSTAPLSLRVNTAPAVTLVAACVAPCTAPANVNLTSTPTDADGTIAKVEFYDGTTLLTTNMVAPWTYSHLTAASGSRSYTAKAFDNDNANKTSSAQVISVTVPPPSIALTAACTAPCNAPAAIALTAIPTSIVGTISKVEFYDGATLLNTDTTSPYSFAANSVAAATHSYMAKVFVTGATAAVAASTAQAVRVNALPTVTLTAVCVAPCTNPATVNLTAAPADSDGTIAKVEFYDGVTLLTTKTATPWTYSHTTAATGSHSYSAKAFDNSGASAASVVQTVTVTLPPPTVSSGFTCITNPCTAPANITLTATPANIVGTVSKVELFSGATLVGQATLSGSNYVYNWINVAAGSYSVTARVTNSLGAQTTSIVMPITVNAAAVSSLNLQLSGGCMPSGCTAPATAGLAVDAYDLNGNSANDQLTKVEFYEGSTLLITKTSQPWTHDRTALAAGAHTFTAKGYDLGSLAAVTQALTITVVEPPSVTLIATCTQPCSAPATVLLTATKANATQTNGAGYSVYGVDMYDGGTWLGRASSTGVDQFTFTVTNLYGGSHSFNARLYTWYDNQTVATSSAVALSVTGTTLTLGWRPNLFIADNTALGAVVFSVHASVASGSVTGLKYYADGVFIGDAAVQGDVFAYTWHPLQERRRGR